MQQTWQCLQECVLSHMNGSCHIWMSHVTYIWVMHAWNSTFKHCVGIYLLSNESCYTWMNLYAFTCDTAYSYLWHNPFICLARLMHMCAIYVTWLMYICDMTHSYVWYDSHMNALKCIHKACHTWMHLNEVSHLWISQTSHVTYDRI